ncbi:hypothetical protein ACFX19_038902 [Malus domestica]
MEEMVAWSTSKARRRCGRAGNLRWRLRAKNDRLRPMQAGRSNFHYHFSLLFRSEKMVKNFDNFAESFVFIKLQSAKSLCLPCFQLTLQLAQFFDKLWCIFRSRLRLSSAIRWSRSVKLKLPGTKKTSWTPISTSSRAR